MQDLFEVIATGEAHLKGDEVVVNISDVITDVEMVHPTKLEAGDVLFDCFGGELPLRRVRHYKYHTATVREDGVYDRWFYADGKVTRKVRA
jgi:hypothetical protein